MNQIEEWAVGELCKLLQGLLELDDIKQLVRNVIKEGPTSINETISGILDFSRKETKLFIQEFVTRVETQNRYDS